MSGAGIAYYVDTVPLLINGHCRLLMEPSILCPLSTTACTDQSKIHNLLTAGPASLHLVLCSCRGSNIGLSEQVLVCSEMLLALWKFLSVYFLSPLVSLKVLYLLETTMHRDYEESLLILGSFQS